LHAEKGGGCGGGKEEDTLHAINSVGKVPFSKEHHLTARCLSFVSLGKDIFQVLDPFKRGNMSFQLGTEII
jgi:hypothetical protein